MDDQTRRHEGKYSRARVESNCRRLIRHPEGYSRWRSLVGIRAIQHGILHLQVHPRRGSPKTHPPPYASPFFKVGSYIATKPLVDIGEDAAFQHPHWRMGDVGKWRTVDNERFGLDWISAVAAWFAHEVRISQDVPVGIIESHFGGSSFIAGCPANPLENSPEFTRGVIEPYRVQKKKWDDAYATWQHDPNRDPNRPPTEPWKLSLSLQCDDCTHNAVRMRGVIWYQGESNQGGPRPIEDSSPLWSKNGVKLLSKMIWLFLPCSYPFGKVRVWPRSPWSEMRESIALLEKSLPFTATVVSTDCGLPDEIHPPLKKPIGQRLALAARARFTEKRIWSTENRGPKRLSLRKIGFD